MSKILSIAIPTYNRLTSLQKTLTSLSVITKMTQIDVIVIDNCSDDGTWEWLQEKQENLGIQVRRNPFNLGIEGNIIQCLMIAEGSYVWLLSDHMVLRSEQVKNFIAKLEQGLEFTLGYAPIGAYGRVFENEYTPKNLDDIDPIALGKIMFFMGNISAFVANKKYLESCARFLFRFSGYSYPQLGVFVNLKETDTIVELDIVSDFLIQKTNNKAKGKSYNSFKSRFISFVLALKKIKELNPKVNWSENSLENRMLLGPLVFDSVLYLCTDKSLKYQDFIFCLLNYPGYIKIFFLVCSLLSTLPLRLQIGVSTLIFNVFLKKIYPQVKINLEDSNMSKSQILE